MLLTYDYVYPSSVSSFKLVAAIIFIELYKVLI